MSVRPVFIPSLQGKSLVRVEPVEFKWHSGLSLSQKRRSVDALHSSARCSLNISRILEVSTKSTDPAGVALSAMNLQFVTARKKASMFVESAYQGSKVFEQGGPFVDIRLLPGKEARKDERLHNSGRLIGFRFSDDWSLSPPNAFYIWLYINALRQNHDRMSGMFIDNEAFTDIEFNPSRSVSCQAHALALYVALYRRRMLDEAISSKQRFMSMLSEFDVDDARGENSHQHVLFASSDPPLVTSQKESS